MSVKDIERYYKQVYEPLVKCKRCPLRSNALHVVGGDGLRSPTIWLMGEAPGAEEDLYGKPFIGRAGKFLNKMLDDAGLSRDNFYITNMVKCRPPDNRPPTDFEIFECTLNLRNEIRILQPQVIITMGNTATHGFLTRYVNRREPVPTITSARSNAYIKKPNENPSIRLPEIVIPVFHPSYCMRNKMAYAVTVDDFKKIALFIQEDKDVNLLGRKLKWLLN